MPEVVMYCTNSCPFCVRAEKLLNKKDVDVTKFMIDSDPSKLKEMLKRTDGARTVPQIFIGDTYVGGFDELSELDIMDELDELLVG